MKPIAATTRTSQRQLQSHCYTDAWDLIVKENMMPSSTPARSALTGLFRATAAALVVALLAACTGGTATPTAAPTTAPATAQPTEAPANTPEPTDEPEPTEEPTEEATEEPTEEPTTEPVAESDVKLVDATFAKELSENQEPIDPTEEFYPDETVYLSLQFEGRPEQGVVGATFFWKDQEIAGTEVDLADANSGVIISIGESTFVGFNLTHENPLPLSKDYRVETTLNGEPLETYTYSVVPPADAIPSEITEVVTAHDATDTYEAIDPATEFVAEDEVHLVGAGNFGKSTWLRVEWYVSGELDDAGTREVGPLEDNLEGGGFTFSFRPENGWPEGEHEAVLIMNDEEVGRYTFTVGS